MTSKQSDGPQDDPASPVDAKDEDDKVRMEVDTVSMVDNPPVNIYLLEASTPYTYCDE